MVMMRFLFFFNFFFQIVFSLSRENSSLHHHEHGDVRETQQKCAQKKTKKIKFWAKHIKKRDKISHRTTHKHTRCVYIKTAFFVFSAREERERQKTEKRNK